MATTWNERLLYQLLERHWGYHQLRPHQAEIIQAAVEGADTLAILPTGGGKSLCYQLAGILRGGLTLVVSPLIALMQDQVEELNRRELPATLISSFQGKREIQARLDAAQQGRLKFLYLAPERLHSPELLQRLGGMQVTLLAVDEAHCISQWGHDFRKAYREILGFRAYIRKAPALALTATATPAVRQDIIEQLELRPPQVFVGDFVRPNLRYFVRIERERTTKLLEVVEKMRGHSGLIYVQTRRRATELARLLQSRGYSAAPYHAELPQHQRELAQEQWLQGQVAIIVATSAFGMGINKPNVRFVAHDGPPADLESYYQEAGRAGRDGQVSIAVLVCTPQDLLRRERLAEDRLPSLEEVQSVYTSLADACQLDQYRAPARTFGIDLPTLAEKTELTPERAHRCLELLAREQLLHYHPAHDRPATLQILAQRNYLEHFAYNRDETWQNLVDSLLRLDGQVLTRDCPFDPPELARMLDLTPEELESRLQTLHRLEFVRYRHSRTLPEVRFLQPRRQLTPKLLNWSHYHQLTDESQHRTAALLAYVRAQSDCRAQVLARYFGQQDPPRCGVCDTCVQANRQQPTAPQPKAPGMPVASANPQARPLEEHLVAAVQAGPQDMNELLAGLPYGAAPQREAALRQLLQAGALRLFPDLRVGLPEHSTNRVSD